MSPSYMTFWKVAAVVDAILPRSWALGPPLPTYFQVSWPKALQSRIPHSVGMSSDKFDVMKSDFAYKVSGFGKNLRR